MYRDCNIIVDIFNIISSDHYFLKAWVMKHFVLGATLSHAYVLTPQEGAINVRRFTPDDSIKPVLMHPWSVGTLEIDTSVNSCSSSS